jgi:hypothetical protein
MVRGKATPIVPNDSEETLPRSGRQRRPFCCPPVDLGTTGIKDSGNQMAARVGSGRPTNPYKRPYKQGL